MGGGRGEGGRGLSSHGYTHLIRDRGDTCSISATLLYKTRFGGKGSQNELMNHLITRLFVEQHIAYNEHALKISALYLFRLGIDSVWNIFEIKDCSVTQLINDGGDYRTATPGLLNILFNK